MKLISIETGNFKLDGGAMFGVVPKVLWSRQYESDENNLCNLAMRSLLVDTGDRRILIDSGIGDKQDAKFFGYYFLNGDASLARSLQEAGYSAADITDVIHTHLHFDHCGGSVVRANNELIPAFPNAVYHVSRPQWEWANMPNNREKASFFPENYLPLLEHGRLRLVENPGELFPGVEVRFFFGHTDGLMIPIVATDTQKVVFAGDLIPLMAQLPVAWICAYDIRPLVAMEEKELFLNEAYHNNYVLFFQHDIHGECCRVDLSNKGFRAGFPFSLAEVNS